MIVTTTSDVQSRHTVGPHGLVFGEAILGTDAVRHIFASVCDVVGGRSDAVGRMAAVHGHRLPA